MADIIGIDVSEFQGQLDWQKIKSAGIRFAIIRGGYGQNAVDSQFYNNIQGALANGIPVGVYWFSYALDAEDARQEAQKCLSLLKDYHVQLPIFYDFEYDTIRYAAEQGVTLGKTQYNQFALAFLTEVEAAGYTGGIYFNLDYYYTLVDFSLLGGFARWYAQYASKPDISDYDIWQCSGSGTISGVSGQFDMDLLKNTSLLDPDDTITGWIKRGDNWYYYNEEGTMVENQWQQDNGNWYYLGADGAMVTNKQLYLDDQGKMVPMAGSAYYHLLRNVTDPLYRQTLDKLISQGVLKGRGGSGEDLILDLTEDSVRLLVMLDRAEMFK